MTDLRQAAQAVVDRWDSPNWEWKHYGSPKFLPTATLMSALRKALAEQQAEPVQQSEPVAWQLIETAPKDGSAILVMRDIWPGTKSGRAEECNAHNTYVAAWWANENNGDGTWVCYMDATHDPKCPVEPTHWMLLPPPPNTAPPQQQAEPVASIYVTLSGDREFDDWKHELPVGRNFLYTTPPQRKPLTNEEIAKAFNEAMAKRPKDASNAETNRLFVRAIEAAHGIKENT